MTNNAAARRPKFSVAIHTDTYKNLINRTLGDPKRAQRFIASISSAVAVNPALQECDAGTILSGALLGESLNLSPSPQLGQYYLVPFNDSKKGIKNAQFVLGYKGYIQLAIRSGQYKKLSVAEIKEGELISWNPLEEEIELKLIEDDEVRANTPTMGYYAMFEYINGFRKALYWSKSKMENHAITYSKGYSAKKGYTFWEKNFDEMAKKTMLRQLISKWGIMSIEMTCAYINDGTVGSLNDDGTREYVVNTYENDENEIISQEEAPIDAEPDSVQDETSVKDKYKQVKLSEI